jgi:hypothetical protein
VPGFFHFPQNLFLLHLGVLELDPISLSLNVKQLLLPGSNDALLIIQLLLHDFMLSRQLPEHGPPGLLIGRGLPFHHPQLSIELFN